MQTSQRGLNLIKDFEGLELEAYLDAVDVWTIGYGHTSRAGPPKVTPGMEITEARAEEILRNDLKAFERDVDKAVKAEVSQNMFDALVSLTYNIGPTNMRRSTLVRRLNNKDYEGAADAFLMWVKAGGRVLRGLQRRRHAERDLFLDGFDNDVGEADDEENRGLPVEEETQRRGNLMKSRTMGGAAATGTAGAAAIGAGTLGDDDQPGEPANPAPPSSAGPEPQTPPQAPEDPGTPPSTDDEPPAPPVDRPDEADDDELVEGTEVPSDDLFVSAFEGDETTDAIVIGAGVLAVLSAIWVAAVRYDDWRNHRR